MNPFLFGIMVSIDTLTSPTRAPMFRECHRDVDDFSSDRIEESGFITQVAVGFLNFLNRYTLSIASFYYPNAFALYMVDSSSECSTGNIVLVIGNISKVPKDLFICLLAFYIFFIVMWCLHYIGR